NSRSSQPDSDSRAPTAQLALVSGAEHRAVSLGGLHALPAVRDQAKHVAAVALFAELDARVLHALALAGAHAQLLGHGSARGAVARQYALCGRRVGEASLVHVALDLGHNTWR